MKSLWKDKFILDAYRLSKQGMRVINIAKILGISKPTFDSWVKNKKGFAYALKEGRKECYGTGKKANTLQIYIYNRLSPDVRKVWRKINRMNKEKQGPKKITAMLERRGMYVRQSLFIYAWTHSNFNFAAACRKVNIPRATFEHWRKTDKGFNLIVLEVERWKKDFWENHLYQLGAAGSEGAILYANKTINQNIFPDPKKQIDLNVSGNVNVNITCLADLKLGPKTRKILLNAIRKYNEELEKIQKENEECQ